MAFIASRRRASFVFCFGAVLACTVVVGCSAPPDGDANEESLALVEEGLTSMDVEVVGKLDPNADPAPIPYSSPSRYRALEIASTRIEELELEITAEGGKPLAWIVDASFRAIATGVSSGSSARVRCRVPSTTSRTYYLLVRETSYRTTVIHVRHPYPKPPPPPPPPPPPAPAARCESPIFGGRSVRVGEMCGWAEDGVHREGVCVDFARNGGTPDTHCRQGCFIDGKWHGVGKQNPANPCQICDPIVAAETRLQWTDLRRGYESSYPTCTACLDANRKRTIRPGGACYDPERAASGTCAAGKCR